MSRRAAIVLVVALAATALLVVRYKRESDKSFPGRPLAPDFTVTDIDGRKLRLSDYKGKVVLLDFWATWCGPCRTEVPEFVKLQKKYGARGLQVIGISLDDDTRPVRNFYARFNMNYPVALGDAKLAESFGGILGLPVAFLIDRGGRIAAKHVGQTGPAAFEEDVSSLLGRSGGK